MSETNNFTKEETQILKGIIKVQIYDLENSEPRPSKRYHRCYTFHLKNILKKLEV